MRVLWISPTGGLFGKVEVHLYNGGGWIEGLQLALKEFYHDISLGIVFLSKTNYGFKRQENDVVYYPIYNSIWSKLVCNIRDGDYKYKNQLLSVIRDFNPDIIHYFGVEQWFSYIPAETSIPCVVHLQGLVSPIQNAYLPIGMSYYQYTGYKRRFVNMIRGSEKKYLRVEQLSWQNVSYCFGRTLFDSQVADLFSSNISYFHIDEILRSQFYNASKWHNKNTQKVSIISIVTAASYKGLDFVLKTSKLLKDKDVTFEWNIVGLSDNDAFVKKYEKFYGIEGKNNNVYYIGYKDADSLIKLLQDASLYVHPSYIDNSPNSVCEAQIIGVPVIACYVGGVPSLIENGKTGWLIPSNGAYELAYYIKHYSDLPLDEISYNEIRVAENRHNKKRIVSDLCSAYKLILNKNEK